MVMNVDELLKKTAACIRQDAAGARIIVFGSYASGNFSKDSDIDLCVIIDASASQLRVFSRMILNKIHPILNLPIDLLVYDRETFRQRAEIPVTLEAEIVETGREL